MPEQEVNIEWMNSLPRGVTRAARWNSLRKVVHQFRDISHVGKVMKVGGLENQKEGWSAMGAVHDEANRYCDFKVSTRTIQETNGTWSLYVMRKPDIVEKAE